MNNEQLTGLIRTLLAAGGPIAGLLALYGLPPDKVTAWLSLALVVLPPVVAGVWSLMSKRDASLAASASHVKGVEVVVDADHASTAVVLAAHDNALPDVKTKEDYQP